MSDQGPSAQAIDQARQNYADSLTQSAIQGMPPGYIAGFTVLLYPDYSVTMGPGVAMVAGIKVELDIAQNLKQSMETFTRTTSMWAYIYLGRDGLYHVDTLIPGFFAKYAANYHPKLAWRFLGRMWIDSTGLTKFAGAGGFGQ